MQYLKQYVKEGDLAVLYAEVLRTASTQYRAVPDISTFHEIVTDWNSEATSHAYYRPGRYIPERTANDQEADEAFSKFWETIGKHKEAEAWGS